MEATAGLRRRPARELDNRIKGFRHSRSHSSGHKATATVAGFMPRRRSGKVLIRDNLMLGVTQGAGIWEGQVVDGQLRNLPFEPQ